MLCFAFFFENVLIPVSKAFTLKDDNGALALRSSIMSLLGSFLFYISILTLIAVVKSNYNDSTNSELYMAIFQDFNDTFGSMSLFIMAILALLQAQCFFQLALEQACILCDQIQRGSTTGYVARARQYTEQELIEHRTLQNRPRKYWMPYMSMNPRVRRTLGFLLFLFNMALCLS